MIGVIELPSACSARSRTGKQSEGLAMTDEYEANKPEEWNYFGYNCWLTRDQSNEVYRRLMQREEWIEHQALSDLADALRIDMKSTVSADAKLLLKEKARLWRALHDAARVEVTAVLAEAL